MEEAEEEDPTLLAYSQEVQAEFSRAAAEYASQQTAPLKNTILKVDIQSETRAVVHVMEFDYVGQEEPQEYRYLLTKTGAGWVIRDKTAACWNCHGSGKEADLEGHIERLKAGLRSEPEERQCSHCGGTGWLSKIFD